MANKIYINKLDFTEYCTGLDKIKETYSEKEDGSIDIGQSSELIFTGAAFKYLDDLILKNACDSINEITPVRIYLTKCKKSLYFDLTSQGVTIDRYNCRANVNLNVTSDKDEQFEILNKTYYWKEEEGFQQYGLGKNSFVKMISVHEVGILGNIFAFIWFNVIDIIISVVNGIIDFINSALWFSDIDKIPQDDLDTDVAGGGEYTTAVKLIDIFTFWANKAGLIFKSDIFQTNKYEFNYGNSVLWSQRVNSGFDIPDHRKKHIDTDNLTNKTCVELLNSLKPVFNAQWKIIGNELIFDRHDTFDSRRKKAFNLEHEYSAGRIIGDIEYSFDNVKNFARFIGAFSNDSADQQGNKAIAFYEHNEEYNPNRIHKNRKGSQRPIINFGAVRCTNDNNGGNYLAGRWPKLTPSHQHSIVLSDEIAALEKLIYLDTRPTIFEGTKFYTTFREQLPNNPNRNPGEPDQSGEFEYNRPFWMSTLYKNFYAIDNPDNDNLRPIEIKKLTWRPQNFCEAAEFMRENKLNTFIQSKYGNGNITNFEIDNEKCVIIFNKINFRCDGF